MSRAQTLIDDGLLIDFSSDTYYHFINMGKTLSEVEYILITHTHTDHFTFEEWFNRYEGAAYNLKAEKLKIYMSEDAYEIMQKSDTARNVNIAARAKRYEFITVRPYEEIAVGDYKVTPLPAVHASPETALIYLIEKDGKTFFFGNDTGIFNEEIDEYLQKHSKKIDLLSLDCTKCDTEYNYYTHMSMSEGRRIADRFIKRNILSENAKLYYNHFSHNGNMIYDDLVATAKEKYGFDVTYDGLSIDI